MVNYDSEKMSTLINSVLNKIIFGKNTCMKQKRKEILREIENLYKIMGVKLTRYCVVYRIWTFFQLVKGGGISIFNVWEIRDFTKKKKRNLGQLLTDSIQKNNQIMNLQGIYMVINNLNYVILKCKFLNHIIPKFKLIKSYISVYNQSGESSYASLLISIYMYKRDFQFFCFIFIADNIKFLILE